MVVRVDMVGFFLLQLKKQLVLSQVGCNFLKSSFDISRLLSDEVLWHGSILGVYWVAFVRLDYGSYSLFVRGLVVFK